MSRARRKKEWSYSAGEWGTNRIRVFERGTKGIFIEWREHARDAKSPKRVRQFLGRIDRDEAKAKADEVAARFRCHDHARPADLTLATLFDMYEAEASRTKSDSKRHHDRRCAEMFLRHLGAERRVSTLSRLDWDRFIRERRIGAIAPRHAVSGRRVGNRVIAYDLKHLLAVLNWAATASDGVGHALIDRNPFKGLPLPKTESPQRAVVTGEQYDALLKAAMTLGPMPGLMLVLANETGHRIGAIRQVRWSDIDLHTGRITWRASSDKIGFQHTTPLSAEALAALTRARALQQTIGDAWVFPSPRDSTKPCSRHLARDWWERIAKAAGIPTGQRYGWHALRRKFASELKHTPLRDLATLGGWKDHHTIITCYMAPDEQTQRAALRERKSLRVSGLS